MKSILTVFMPFGAIALVLAILLFASASSVIAEDSSPGKESKSVEANSVAPFNVLLGRWVRPDGGYQLVVKSIETKGKLDAMYANPNILPFSKAEASLDGKTIKVFLELRAGGYNGSTYTLTYDPLRDVLKGVYFQAVAQEQYEIFFERVKSGTI